MIFSVIGTGNMGRALVGGFIKSGILAPGDVRLCDIDKEKVEQLASETGCQAFTDPSKTVEGADYVLLAVKPQVFDASVSNLKSSLKSDVVVVSIAAGVTLARISGILGDDASIVRVMPNTPALVGASVCAVCAKNVEDSKKAFVEQLLGTCGIVVPCDEKTLDAIGCVSGTGPAYVMLFIEAMADAAVKLGIPRKTAMDIAAMTVYGSGKLMVETGTHPAILKDQVCSPGGTTIEGVLALEKGGLRAAVEDAVIAADLKTKALSGGK
ncbi:MAG: pyrroline-5-carboxylate reductase [Clostridiales bacterium]|nr:pyrroline-5-carboxylate reductase [Clostridiales bacterium]